MTTRARTLTTLLLGGLLAGGGWWTQHQQSTLIAPLDGLAPPAIAAIGELAPLQPLDPPPVTRFAAWVERPPLSQSRRPPLPEPPQVSEAPQLPSTPPAFTARLLGVRIQPDNRAALFEVPGQRNARWMAEGEIVHGWTINRIDQSGVFLRYAAQPFELRLWPQ